MSQKFAGVILTLVEADWLKWSHDNTTQRDG